VPKQEIVHLPERTLCGRRFGRIGGHLRVRMDVVERQMPPDVANVREVAKQLAHDRLRLAAERTLEVAVLDHRHWCFHRPADVVALGIDVEIEIGDRLGVADQRSHTHRQRKPCSDAEQ
jgi:hypothetical protein